MVAPLDAGCCELWWASADAAGPRLLDVLDDEERARHARFVRASDRALFLVAHALARIAAGRHVGDEPRAIAYSRDGVAHAKPRFAGPAGALELSISHSGERVVVALSRASAVGVDVERINPGAVEPSLVDTVLCAPERRALLALPEAAQPAAFYRYWTRKEAVLKATGDGLSVSPERIFVSSPTQPPGLVRWSGPGAPAAAVHLYDLDAAPGYSAALAAIGGPLQCSDRDGDALLREWA